MFAVLCTCSISAVAYVIFSIIVWIDSYQSVQLVGGICKAKSGYSYRYVPGDMSIRSIKVPIKVYMVHFRKSECSHANGFRHRVWVVCLQGGTIDLL